jgi:glutathione S-transferase
MARGLIRDPRIGAAPRELLELYSMEGCGSCRRVREILTELDIDYLHRSCPKGGSANWDRLRQHGGQAKVPYLVDANHDVALYESQQIITHLLARYGGAR